MKSSIAIVNTLAVKMIGTLFVLTIFASLAHAQNIQRTFVSTQGNDANAANNCSRNQPCRGFAAAISVVSAGGEVVAIDSGGYGAVTITKSVQITAPTGVYVAITQIGAGNAITINAASADTVVLKGLTLNGLSNATHGIDWNTGSALHVESCSINGFTGFGVNFNAPGKLFVKDTIARNNGVGVFMNDQTVVSIDRSRFENNSDAGVYAIRGGRASISDTVAAGNANSGFYVYSSAVMMCMRCTSSFNGNGFAALDEGKLIVENSAAYGNSGAGMFVSGDGARLRVSNSAITDNQTGLQQVNGGTLSTRRNNTVAGNYTDVSGNPFREMEGN